MKFSNDTLRIAVRYWLTNPVKTVPIYGHISSWDTSEVTDMSELFKDADSFNQPIGNWDVSNVTDMNHMFLRAKAFNRPIGNWDVSNVTNMESMFKDADSFNQPIGNWDVSNVTSMNWMFESAESFNQPIGNWDVSNVTDMNHMFSRAIAFNQPIGNWDVSEETDILNVLYGANSYNKPLNKVGKGYWIKKTFYGESWQKEKLKTKSKINFRGQLIGFHKEYHENGQLKLEVNFTNGIQDDGEVITYHTNGIKARKVMILNQKISGEFSEYHENGNIKTQGYYEKDLCYIEKDFDENGFICDFTVTKFDNNSLVDVLKLWHHERNLIETRYGHISNWDVSKVTNMSNLFSLKEDFNEDISSWDVSNVKTMRSMFESAEAFNQPIGTWDVSKVTNMYNMFSRAKSFNQPIGNWDVSNVKSMRQMFDSAISFNQPIGAWDVSNVTNMKGMFMFWSTSAFNQPIGSWDVSNVENMFEMFSGAQVFNQPLGSWNISCVTTMKRMFSKAESFNQDLSKWPEINSLVKFNRQMFSKEFAKYYDVNSLTRKVDTSTFNKNSKKAIPKIKKLLKTRDYTYVDSALELLRSLEDKSLYEYFLAGVKINSDGTLVTTNIFSGSRQAQPYFDYALISLINFAPKNLNIHESIKRKNIKALKLSAMLAESYGLEQGGYSDLPDCGVFTTSKIPNLAFDNLEEISIFNYQNLESLKFLLNCKKLKRIELTRCDNIKDADLFEKQILKNK